MGKYDNEYEDYYKKINSDKEEVPERKYIRDSERKSSYEQAGYELRHNMPNNKRPKNSVDEIVNIVVATTIIPTVLFTGVFISKNFLGEGGIKVYKHVKEAISTSGFYADKIELALGIEKNTEASAQASLNIDAKESEKENLNDENIDKGTLTEDNKPQEGTENKDNTEKKQSDSENSETEKKEVKEIVADKSFMDYTKNLKGIDIKAKSEEGLVLTCMYKIIANNVAGVVSKVGENAEGYFITIKHDGGLETSYLNLPEIDFEEGEAIKKGDKIAEVKAECEFVFKISKDNEFVSPLKYAEFI